MDQTQIGFYRTRRKRGTPTSLNISAAQARNTDDAMISSCDMQHDDGAVSDVDGVTRSRVSELRFQED